MRVSKGKKGVFQLSKYCCGSASLRCGSGIVKTISDHSQSTGTVLNSRTFKQKLSSPDTIYLIEVVYALSWWSNLATFCFIFCCHFYAQFSLLPAYLVSFRNILPVSSLRIKKFCVYCRYCGTVPLPRAHSSAAPCVEGGQGSRRHCPSAYTRTG